MKNSKICSGLFLLFLSLTVSCYKPPSANTSKISTPPQSSPITSQTLENKPQSSVSPQNSPIKANLFQQALKDYNSKNFEQAEKGFNQVIQTESNNADAHYYLGNIIYNRQEFLNSLPHFEQAAKIDFKSVEKLMALGENQRALKMFDRAIVQYQKASGFEPDNANAYYGMGLTYIGLNNKIAARQQLQKLEPLNKSLGEKLKKEIESLK